MLKYNKGNNFLYQNFPISSFIPTFGINNRKNPVLIQGKSFAVYLDYTYSKP